MSTEAEEFLADMLPRQQAAEQAIHNGDVDPRLALWTRHDPVTLYGAKLSGSGWADLEPMFREVASWFADSVAYQFEVLAAGASGDLAYTVGYEHNDVSVDGQPTTYTSASPTCTGARTGNGASSTGTPTSRRPVTAPPPSRRRPPPPLRRQARRAGHRGSSASLGTSR